MENLLRRQFLKQISSGTSALCASQFLSYFMANGASAAERENAMAKDVADETDNPHFLVYWYVEGGWMGYDMFNPVMTPNNVVNRLDEISDERYRVLNWGDEEYGIFTQGNIRAGYLAEDGRELFDDLAVISSMYTGSSHSKERLRCHMGNYRFNQRDERGEDERSVMQAFAEVYGQPYILPHLSWHWWLSDGELNETQYPGRRGYYHALGPTHAHTIYAGTPDDLRTFMLQMHKMSSDTVNQEIQYFLSNIENHILNDNESEAVKSYHSARQIYQKLSGRGKNMDDKIINQLFNEKQLREAFEISPDDEVITYRSVNGNKARTKFSPMVNVQAMMTYEMMRAGYSCAFFLESRDIRLFDDHKNRSGLWNQDGKPRGQNDTTEKMDREMWKPLKTFVNLLKNTEYKKSGNSLYDYTTIVLTSEFGRTIHGDVDSIIKRDIPENEKKQLIEGQDISQHWPVTSAAFLGGKVKGNCQFGKAGEITLQPIPILPDGSLDPAYDTVTGKLVDGRRKNDQSFIPDHGEIMSTALALSDINPVGKGRNEGKVLPFVMKNHNVTS